MASLLRPLRSASVLHRIRTVGVRILGGSVLFSSLLFVACGDDPAAPAPRCTGVLREGVCIAKCVESRDCSGTQVCAALSATSDAVVEEGLCYTTCAGDGECALGETCTPKPTMAGATAYLCRSRAVEKLPPNGFGVACKAAADCDEAHGLSCTAGRCGLPEAAACKAASECSSDACDDGTCKRPCNRLSDCAVGTECVGLVVGKKPGVCKGKPSLAPGRYSQPCPKGREGKECDADAGFRCIGLKGDPDAYCSKPGDCAADGGCPIGYWCGGIRGDAKEGEGIPASQRTCVKRTFCAPCDTDTDCGFTFGAKCVPDVDGVKFCSTSCTPDKRSCRFGAECVAVGGGDFACRPDAGTCARAKPTGCDPCRNDLDCGPGGYCLGDTIPGAIDKPSVRWCVTPCGTADGDGKRTCPKSPNGVEMICLDENNLDLGTASLGVGKDAAFPGYCFPGVTFDPEATVEIDPPKNVCGNGLRDGDEECDDGNKSAKDGCDACAITAACRFTVPPENGDGVTGLTSASGPIDVVPAECKSFRVDGQIAAGKVNVVQISVATNLATSLAEVFTGAVGSCDADLVLEVRDGVKPDLTVGCKDLLPPDLSSLLDCGKNIGCGDCKETNKCGLCDDDNGVGNCPRALVMRVTSYDGTKVVNASADKTMRLYARSPAAAVPAYTLLFGQLKGDSSSPGALAAGAQYTCW